MARQKDTAFTWSGPVPAPNFTMVPNVYFTDIAPHLSGSEAKVMTYLMFQTFGWHRPEVSQGIEELAAAAGVSRTATVDALRTLERVGLVSVERSTTRNGKEVNRYTLLVTDEPKYVFRQSDCRNPAVLGMPKSGSPPSTHKKTRKDISTTQKSYGDDAYTGGKYGSLVRHD